ncbi:DUF4307 domain-containing protein [Microbacterium sp. 77mftsu3.1]|uniref:DUF4307 domain-containing protein n=1 Tax=Microbacterium sp. 77mftsu3.1 TaxID=1761802 RepID=UPI000376EF93|nr:DUF4307 domain-containing protein [Microbacterium sp. 77mftsu3.1]SDG26862.1 protein of unknown function [Microbacterium sp. 77mftsu3.1]
MTLTDVDRKLAERYGRTRSAASRRMTWVLVGVVAVAATGLLGWSTVSNAINSVDADSTGFAVVDEHTVEVRFQVSIRPDTKVACALEAQDPDHGIVGFRVVELESSDDHTRALTERIRTTAEATTGFVRSCWIL